MSTPTQNQSWIRLNDFTETNFWITVINSTTQIKVKTNEIEIAELSDSGLTLKLPSGSCAEGHLLGFDIIQLENEVAAKGKAPVKNPENEPALFKVSATGKVTGVDRHDKSWNLVAIKFYQVDAKIWQQFLEGYAERQEKVLKVMRSIRD